MIYLGNSWFIKKKKKSKLNSRIGENGYRYVMLKGNSIDL